MTIKRKNIILLTIITIIPSILTLLEPDTGAIIIYLIIFLSIIKKTNIKPKTLIKLTTITLLFIITNITLYITDKEIILNIYGPKILYRIDRLISFKNQNNIQTINSLISIGSHKLIYIPENHNDFIFAAIISKYFYLFPIILLSFIYILKYYLKNIEFKKNISNIINFIILNMLLFQIFYNILMNLSLVPIIGIPLPFISYGGSYLVTLYILIGLSININKSKVV
jgi:rod shape determining protein RodA